LEANNDAVSKTAIKTTMRTLIFIFTLFPFLAYSQAKGVHERILTDSIEALNNGFIDFIDSVFFKRPVQVDSSFKVNAGLGLFKGIDASANKFSIQAQDNVGTEIFNVRNDGRIGIGISVPVSTLDIVTNISNEGIRLHRFGDIGTRLRIFLGDGTNLFRLDEPVYRTNNATHQFVRTDLTGRNYALSVGATMVATFEAQAAAGSKIAIIAKSTGKSSLFFGNENRIDQGFIEYDQENNSIDFGTNITEKMTLDQNGRLGIGVVSPGEKLQVNGKAIIDSSLSTTARSLTLSAAATTFETTSNVMTITGDASENTISTITGANSGQYLILIFVDGFVGITDNNIHSANSIDLSAAFTSADDTTLHLIFDGTSWYEISRSTN